uniref:Uncharacterized protein n=1 Tax=Ananas comosus var. bracteatus TaxID=296719 RepID=A0A6V7QU40_ANACO
MLYTMKWMLPLLALLYFSAVSESQASKIGPPLLKSATFLSPPFFLRPGSVSNKYYFDIPFPKGHIALKSFDAEVVDENGVPVPLHETYLHHWVLERYYGRREYGDLDLSKIILVRNSGICNHTLGQYYGLGSETRRTSTWVPDPYGIEVGKPEEIPLGYEERWLLNIHAIDTRGVEDRLGAPSASVASTMVKEGVEGVTRKLFLKYTVMWVDWDVSVAPVKIYIFDVTDTGEATSDPRRSSCKVEYEVPACSLEDKANGECVHTKTAARLVMPAETVGSYARRIQLTGRRGSRKRGQLHYRNVHLLSKARLCKSFRWRSSDPCFQLQQHPIAYWSNGLFYILVAEMPPPPRRRFRSSLHFQLHLSSLESVIIEKRDTSAGYQSLVIS